MKKLIWILMLVSVATFATIKIDVDQLRSPDHTKVWTPPSATTTLIGTDTANALTNKTLDKLVLTTSQVDTTTTGANAVFPTPTSTMFNFNNASLTSVDGITAPANVFVIIFRNKTGSTVTINNETGVNTTFRIVTGTGAAITLATDASLVLSYSTNYSRWYVTGGSGSGGGGISAWITSHAYLAGDIAIESNKIYNCLTPHTSGTFATDLAGGNWVELSAMTGVDLTSNQTIAGTKTFSSTIAGSVNGNAATVTTNANLTGPITSSGNTTSVASQTGTGSTFVMSAAPTITGHPVIEGVTSTGATGTGKFVFDTSPTLVTPVLGVATATSINSTTIPSSKTLIVSTDNLGNLATTTSAQLAGVISDETGSGALVFGTAPQFTTSVAVGGSPNANAVLDVQSTTKAFMPPRMTTTQKLAIASPTAGMVVYDSTLNAQSTYDGTSWQTGLGTITVDSDWTSYTPTLTASAGTPAVVNGTITGKYRRSGDNVEVTIKYVAGSSDTFGTAGAYFQFGLPSGLSVDTTKLAVTTGGNLTIIGDGAILDSGVAAYFAKTVYDNTSSTVRLQYYSGTNTGVVDYFKNNTIFTFGTSDSVYMRFSVPITGWSSNAATYSGASSNTDWTAQSGGNVITATTSNPTKATTPATDEVWYKRSGGDLEVRFAYRQTASTGAASGSGDYLFAVPSASGCTIDTTKVKANAITVAQGLTMAMSTEGSVGGAMMGSTTAASIGTGSILVYDSTKVRAALGYTTGGSGAYHTMLGSTLGMAWQASVSYSGYYKVPCVGWSSVSQVMANVSGYAQAPGVAGTANPNLEHLVANFGTTNASTVCSASPCSYLDQIGTGITSITRSSAGNYAVNTAKTYSKLKCYVQAQSATTLYEAYVASCSNCSSTTFQTGLSTSTVDTMGAIFCTGMY